MDAFETFKLTNKQPDLEQLFTAIEIISSVRESITHIFRQNCETGRIEVGL